MEGPPYKFDSQQLRELMRCGISIEDLEPVELPETFSATVPIRYDRDQGMKNAALIENDIRRLLPAHHYTGPHPEREELLYTGGTYGDVSLRITSRSIDVHFDGGTPDRALLRQLERIVEQHVR